MCDCDTFIGLKTESSSNQFKTVEFSHTWTIPNFSFRVSKPGKFLKSCTFSSGTGNNFKWSLDLYPNGVREEDKEFISLFLILESDNQESVSVKFQFSLWNAKDAKFYTIVDTYGYEFDATYNSYGSRKLYRRKSLLDPTNGFLSDDKLIVLCKMWEGVKTLEVFTTSELNEKKPELKSNLAHNLELMFKRGMFSDVTLLVGNEKFSVHKNILAARSPVFAAMFEHDMVERSRNEVVITDIDPKVVEEMLTFIYTDEVPNLMKTNETMVQKLLTVADKYDLCRLKTMCEQVLCVNISADNVVEMLLFADLYKAERLKTLATTFISIRATDLMKTTPWMNMLLENSNSIAEAFAAAKHSSTDQHSSGHSCKYHLAGPFLPLHSNSNVKTVKTSSKLNQNLEQNGRDHFR